MEITVSREAEFGPQRVTRHQTRIRICMLPPLRLKRHLSTRHLQKQWGTNSSRCGNFLSSPNGHYPTRHLPKVIGRKPFIMFRKRRPRLFKPPSVTPFVQIPEHVGISLPIESVFRGFFFSSSIVNNANFAIPTSLYQFDSI